MTAFNSIKISLCLLFAATLFSCKKETEYAQYPYNTIESFKIDVNGTGKIDAAIDNNNIIVYWPYYETVPATVQPEISISENATISPATGTAIPFNNGTKFTVKAGNGTEKEYTLKVIVDYPPIQIYEQTYAAIKGGSITINNGREIRYIIRDVSKTKLYIIDDTNKETELPLEFYENNGALMMRINIPDTDDLKIGAYKMKITSGSQTITTTNKIFGITYPGSMLPKVDALTSPLTVKRGQTITFTGTGFTDMKNARVFKYNNDFSEGEIGTLELVNFTATSATYKVPANFPTGTYQLGGYEADGMFIALRTSDFIGFWNWSKENKVYVYVGGDVKISITD